MSSPEDQIYEPVKTQADRNLAFEQVATLPVAMMLESAKQESFSVKFHKLTDTHLILYIMGGPRKLIIGEQVTLIFALSQGHFLLRGLVYGVGTNETKIALARDSELLRLQRRNHFRLRVPKAFGMRFHLSTLNGKKADQECDIYDFSAGGIALEQHALTPNILKGGDHITARIEVPNRNSSEITGVVRHLWPDNIDPSQRIGIEFVNLSATDQQFMLSLALQIHREAIRTKIVT